MVEVYVDGAWSEDTNLSGIWVLDLATGAKHRILPVGESPCWSPDGSLLALEVNGEICVVSPDGTNLRRLTSSGANYFPTWSASGTRIIYESQDVEPTYIESRVYTVDLTGGQPAPLCSGPVRHGLYPSWEPGGTRIAVSWLPGDTVLQSQIFTVDSASCTPFRVTADGTWDSYPRFSPDANSLAFTAQKSDGSPPDLWVIRRSGGARQLTTGGGVEPAWSPDGAWVAFQNDELRYSIRQHVIWAVNVADRRLVQLTDQWVEPCSAAPLIACRKDSVATGSIRFHAAGRSPRTRDPVTRAQGSRTEEE